MSMKFDDLKALQKQLENKKELVDDILESCLKEIALRFLRKVIKDTPSVTGTLRKGWAIHLNNLKVDKKNGEYSITLTNDAQNEEGVRYASYVEYGHRDRSLKGWVPGQFIMTIAEKDIRNLTPKLVEKKVTTMLQEKFNDRKS